MGNNACQQCVADPIEVGESPYELKEEDIKPKLQPITFTDDENAVEKDAQTPQTNVKFTSESQNEFATSEKMLFHEKTTRSSQGRSSASKFAAINIDEVNLIDRQIADRQKTNNQMMDVPFPAIKLAVSPRLLDQLRIHGKAYLNVDETNHVSQQNWKLHSEGYYIKANQSNAKEQNVKILTEKLYFEGNCKYEDNNLFAEGKGLMINEIGIYQGNFSKGRADVQGKYFVTESKTTYIGDWRRGLLFKGIIDCEEFTFTGQLVKGIPQGNGHLTLKKKDVKFTGPFEEGEYEGKDCVYQTERYVYQGEFHKGKKQGFGRLRQKEHKVAKKDKKIKYTPPIELKGRWQEDEFLSTQQFDIGIQTPHQNRKESKKKN